MTQARPYAGVDAGDRQARRRARLLEAGLDLLGRDADPAELTVRGICQEAGLATRYFYENFSDKEQLKGRYVDTTADNFRMTMDISCYSFTAVAQRAEKMMTNGGSMVTLSYLGAERNMPHYNVMGVAKAALEASVRYMAEDLGKKNIRVNSISAGPIKTLAFAPGIIHQAF